MFLFQSISDQTLHTTIIHHRSRYVPAYLDETYPFRKLTDDPNQTFHYTRRITPKHVTSLRFPSPRHSVKASPRLLAQMLMW